jgi:hypothetical protein
LGAARLTKSKFENKSQLTTAVVTLFVHWLYTNTLSDIVDKDREYLLLQVGRRGRRLWPRRPGRTSKGNSPEDRGIRYAAGAWTRPNRDDVQTYATWSMHLMKKRNPVCYSACGTMKSKAWVSSNKPIWKRWQWREKVRGTAGGHLRISPPRKKSNGEQKVIGNSKP